MTNIMSLEHPNLETSTTRKGTDAPQAHVNRRSSTNNNSDTRHARGHSSPASPSLDQPSSGHGVLDELAERRGPAQKQNSFSDDAGKAPGTVELHRRLCQAPLRKIRDLRGLFCFSIVVCSAVFWACFLRGLFCFSIVVCSAFF